MTRAFIVILSASIFFLSCNNAGKAPNVSGIKIDITTTRFEKNLFDTTSNSLCNYLKQLQSSSPAFTTNFLHTILNTDPQWSTDSTAAYVNSFVKAYRTVYDSSENIFNNFSKYENEIKNGLQFVKYYFPNYKLPKKIITYIGPVDGYGDILSEEGLLVGLQQHLGKNYSLYQSEMVQQFYPEYISSRFEPDYIAINCMKNIADDIYPEKEFDKPLINQMIENGKRLYLLQQFLPGTDAYKLIGYRKEQFKDCNDHEAVIWNLFVKNSLLQTTDKNIIKNYVDESPKTQELGEGAPGNIGSFAGWQIVKKYMDKNPATSLQALLNLDAETIFQAAKYKPW